MKTIDLTAAFDEQLISVSERLVTAGERAMQWCDLISVLESRNQHEAAAQTRKNALVDLAHQRAASDTAWSQLAERALYAQINE